MTSWRLLITPPAPGSWNMAIDESILEHSWSGDSLPTLRLYAWQPACLSIGHAQPFADVDTARLRARGIPTYGILPFPLSEDDELRMHGDNERLPVRALGWGAEYLFRVLQTTAGR